MNRIHKANRKAWDAISQEWQERVDAEGKWRRCHVEPSLALRQQELEHLGDVSGKKVCVLGSGDNLIVFALAGLGARVTSVDISQMQLDIAADRANELGLDVFFVRADVVALDSLGDEAFDVVYTGGHVAVWVSDLNSLIHNSANDCRHHRVASACIPLPFERLLVTFRQHCSPIGDVLSSLSIDIPKPI